MNPTAWSIKTTTVTTTTVTLDFGDEYEEVVVPIEPAEWIDPWINDLGTVLVYAAHDDYPMDYEWPEGVEFVQGNPNYAHHISSINGANEWIAEQEAAGKRVFPVGVYEHGGIDYSLAGESLHHRDQWDYCVGGAIAIPTDYTDPEEAARAILADYTAWCNGDTYVIVSMHREDVDQPWSDDYDTIGGYFGSSRTQEAVNTEYA